MKKPKEVRVVWIDSSQGESLVFLEDARKQAPVKWTSLGFLLRESKDEIVIIRDFPSEDVLVEHEMAIPKVAILEMKVIDPCKL